MKRVILAAILAIASLAIFHKAHAAVDMSSSSNNLPDSQFVSWGSSQNTLIYGSSSNNYLRSRVGGVDQIGITNTGVGIGTNNPGNSQLTVVPSGTSQSGMTINSPTGTTVSQTQWQINGSTVAAVGAQGHVMYRMYTVAQVNALIPDAVGAHITVNNMTSTVFFPGGYSDCIATGTAVAQFAVVGGTHGVFMNGCGSGN